VNGVDRDVLDMTGLEGRFDFTLRWTPPQPAVRDHDGVAAVTVARPSIFTALQEQLGLKLEPTARTGARPGDRSPRTAVSELTKPKAQSPIAQIAHRNLNMMIVTAIDQSALANFVRDTIWVYPLMLTLHADRPGVCRRRVSASMARCASSASRQGLPLPAMERLPAALLHRARRQRGVGRRPGAEQPCQVAGRSALLHEAAVVAVRARRHAAARRRVCRAATMAHAGRWRSHRSRCGPARSQGETAGRTRTSGNRSRTP
jgi:hypothetical protein